MNNAIFASMREQMAPSQEARDALAQKLAGTKRPAFPVKRCIAAAACAAVIVAAVPVGRMVRDHWKWKTIEDGLQTDCRARPENPHSYVLAGDSATCWPEDTVTTYHRDNATDGAGDEDQDMTPGEVADNMLEAGFSQEDVDAYLASGWQLTWANWWKFFHLAEESGDCSLDALLEFSASAGLAVNTGEETVPSEDYASDAPVQEDAVAAYQNLMARFEEDCGQDSYPEWYGGAFIDSSSDCLVVNIVESEYYGPNPDTLYAQIKDWARSDAVSFQNVRYSLNYLRFLQTQAVDAMSEMGLDVGCGVNEETNQVELDLPYAADEVLWRLAELDPTDTAILVRAGYYAATHDTLQ